MSQRLSDNQTAYNRTLRFLSFRPRSTEEIRRYLKRIGFSEYTEEITDRLTEVGLLDDEAFTTLWISERSRNRGVGKHRLRIELLDKGIEPKLIDRKLIELIDTDEEKQTALAFGAKRLRALSNLEEPIITQKLTAFLLARGYDYDTVRKVVSELLYNRIVHT